MRAWLAAIALWGACACGAWADEHDDVLAPITAFHAALTAGEPEAAAAQLGPSFFIADERSDTEIGRVRAHLYLSGERLAAWPGRYLDEVGPHSSESVMVSTSIRGDAAVVITRDTGSNAFRSWRDEETTWFLGRIDGRWRIAGYIIRDFQAPH
jgi:hypothetical protein